MKNLKYLMFLLIAFIASSCEDKYELDEFEAITIESPDLNLEYASDNEREMVGEIPSSGKEFPIIPDAEYRRMARVVSVRVEGGTEQVNCEFMKDSQSLLTGEWGEISHHAESDLESLNVKIGENVSDKPRVILIDLGYAYTVLRIKLIQEASNN